MKEDKNSEKNLTNTEAQTIPKTLNDEDIIFEDEDKDEEVSETIISQLKKISETAPKLQLIVKESLFLQEGLIIKINALGLIGKSLRDKKDGFTYFGIISLYDEKDCKKIDFSTGQPTINEKKNNNDNNTPINYGRQFSIRFDLDEKLYFIKDCSGGNGYGTFMKLINEMKIEDSTLINIGNNYIVFTLGVDKLEPEESDTLNDEKILSVKVFGGELVNYSYAFNQKQFKKIYIGNKEECNIVLEDNLLDDIHCTIKYKKGKGWFIIDGYEEKKSINGTWVGLSEETEIFEGMIIQSNQNIYQCHITY